MIRRVQFQKNSVEMRFEESVPAMGSWLVQNCSTSVGGSGAVIVAKTRFQVAALANNC